MTVGRVLFIEDFPQTVYAGDGIWRLCHDWTAYIATKGGNNLRKITIPAGFNTDLASIPYALWGLAGKPSDETHRRTSLLHDWLYTKGGGERDRKYADEAYYGGLRADGKGAVAAFIEYVVVRLLGWRHFNYKGRGKKR